MNTKIKTTVGMISGLAVLAVLASITPSLSSHNFAAFAGGPYGGWYDDGFYGHHHKHNFAHQGINQDQFSDQDARCFSGITTFASCNNVDVQSDVNTGNNALGQR